MRNTPSNSDNVIDSRNIIARIEELERERDRWEVPDPSTAHDLADTALAVEDRPASCWDDAYPDEAAELAALTSLAAEGEDYAPDWKHGEPLIRDSFFTEYAMEMLEDIGDLPKGLPHYVVIDEEATARNIQQDYTEVDFDGVTYWVR